MNAPAPDPSVRSRDTDQGGRSADAMRVRNLATWAVLAPAVGLALLGILFVTAPEFGAAIYGIPAPDGHALAYVAAIGVRDIAFGLFVLALAWLSTRRSVGVALALTVLIPAGDLLIILVQRGAASPGHLLLHAASGAYMGGASWWLLRPRPS